MTYALANQSLVEQVGRSQTGCIKTHTTDGQAWSYVYDAAGRLKSGARATDSYTYNYDANSNRTTANLNGSAISYSYDSNDRLTSFTGSGGTVAYDSHGNTTSLDGLSLGWDGNDRNTSISKTGTNVTYTRDAGDRVKTRSENSSVTRYLYSFSGSAPAGLTYPNSVNVEEFYLQLPGGVVRTVRPYPGDVWLYPNLHGDTLVTVDPAGVVAGGPFTYGPYGEQVGGSHADQTSTTADYGWVGQHQKATETLLQNVVQMGARPYHPAFGRFLGVDPVEGGTANDYVYVTDPVNSFDLNGMWGLPNPIAAVKKAVEVVSDNIGTITMVAEVVSMVPGPIGQVAAGVAAVGYAIQGDYVNAALMVASVVLPVGLGQLTKMNKAKAALSTATSGGWGRLAAVSSGAITEGQRLRNTVRSGVSTFASGRAAVHAATASRFTTRAAVWEDRRTTAVYFFRGSTVVSAATYPFR